MDAGVLALSTEQVGYEQKARQGHYLVRKNVANRVEAMIGVRLSEEDSAGTEVRIAEAMDLEAVNNAAPKD